MTNRKEGLSGGSGRKVWVGGGIKGLLVAGGIQLLLSYFEEVYQRFPCFHSLPVLIHTSSLAEDGTDTVFRNVGLQ